MAYLPDNFLLPNTEEIDTKEWWEHAQRKELVIQQCTDCNTFRHPPDPVCFECHSFNFKLTPVEGKGRIYSYIICHHPVHPALREWPPYNVAIIELPGAGNVRMVGNIIDAKDEELYMEMPVKITWEERQGVVIPQWLKDT